MWLRALFGISAIEAVEECKDIALVDTQAAEILRWNFVVNVGKAGRRAPCELGVMENKFDPFADFRNWNCLHLT